MNKIVPFPIKNYNIVRNQETFYQHVMEQYGYEFAYDGYPLTAVHIRNTQMLGETGTINQTFVQNQYIQNQQTLYQDYRQLHVNIQQMQKTMQAFSSDFYVFKDLSKQMQAISQNLNYIQHTAAGRMSQASREQMRAFEENASASVKKKITLGNNIFLQIQQIQSFLQQTRAYSANYPTWNLDRIKIETQNALFQNRSVFRNTQYRMPQIVLGNQGGIYTARMSQPFAQHIGTPAHSISSFMQNGAQGFAFQMVWNHLPVTTLRNRALKPGETNPRERIEIGNETYISNTLLSSLNIPQEDRETYGWPMVLSHRKDIALSGDTPVSHDSSNQVKIDKPLVLSEQEQRKAIGLWIQSIHDKEIQKRFDSILHTNFENSIQFISTQMLEEVWKDVFYYNNQGKETAVLWPQEKRRRQLNAILRKELEQKIQEETQRREKQAREKKEAEAGVRQEAAPSIENVAQSYHVEKKTFVVRPEQFAPFALPLPFIPNNEKRSTSFGFHSVIPMPEYAEGSINPYATTAYHWTANQYTVFPVSLKHVNVWQGEILRKKDQLFSQEKRIQRFSSFIQKETEGWLQYLEKNMFQVERHKSINGNLFFPSSNLKHVNLLTEKLQQYVVGKGIDIEHNKAGQILRFFENKVWFPMGFSHRQEALLKDSKVQNFIRVLNRKEEKAREMFSAFEPEKTAFSPAEYQQVAFFSNHMYQPVLKQNLHWMNQEFVKSPRIGALSRYSVSFSRQIQNFVQEKKDNFLEKKWEPLRIIRKIEEKVKKSYFDLNFLSQKEMNEEFSGILGFLPLTLYQRRSLEITQNTEEQRKAQEKTTPYMEKLPISQWKDWQKKRNKFSMLSQTERSMRESFAKEAKLGISHALEMPHSRILSRMSQNNQTIHRIQEESTITEQKTWTENKQILPISFAWTNFVPEEGNIKSGETQKLELNTEGFIPVSFSFKKEAPLSAEGQNVQDIEKTIGQKMLLAGSSPTAGRSVFSEDFPDIEFWNASETTSGNAVFSKPPEQTRKKETEKKTLTEEEMDELIQKITTQLEEKMEGDISSIADRVYDAIEDRLRFEKIVRGMF